MGNRWRNSGNSVRLYFGDSKITADGDCSHEIKRHLLLGRKIDGEIKKIFRQAKVKRIQFHPTNFTTNVKGIYIVKKYKRAKMIYKINHKQLRKWQ